MPNITGKVFGTKEFRISNATGCFTALDRSQSGFGDVQSSDYHNFTLDASLSSQIYGNNDTVMPASVNTPIIVYLGK